VSRDLLIKPVFIGMDDVELPPVWGVTTAGVQLVEALLVRLFAVFLTPETTEDLLQRLVPAGLQGSGVQQEHVRRSGL
jgi:hypothetical protein